MTVLDNQGRVIPQRESLITDLQGRATQLSVPFGTVTLRISAQGSPDALTHTFEFEAAPESPYEIELPGR